MSSETGSKSALLSRGLAVSSGTTMYALAPIENCAVCVSAGGSALPAWSREGGAWVFSFNASTAVVRLSLTSSVSTSRPLVVALNRRKSTAIGQSSGAAKNPSTGSGSG